MDYTDELKIEGMPVSEASAYQSLPPEVLIAQSIFYIIFAVVIILGMWKVFTKAGKPGWASLIPLYNSYIVLKIVDKPGWWLLLYLIPLVNIIISVIVALELAKRFGRSEAFGIFLLFLFQPIGMLILGFGKSKYSGAPATPTTQTPLQPKQSETTK